MEGWREQAERSGVNLWTMKLYIYVLLLPGGERYVGLTNNTARRLRDHQRGKGSIHTRGKTPISIEKIIEINVNNYMEGVLQENAYADQLRKQYGKEKVFGGELSKRYQKWLFTRTMSTPAPGRRIDYSSSYR